MIWNSDNLNHLQRIKTKYNLQDYKNKNNSTLCLGVFHL